ncbi:MAG: hypothetical protein IKO94_04575, partial [Selenomonadaceae bacterium]|nr:hypothetical protein [Selenomonadaceae bacterium]
GAGNDTLMGGLGNDTLTGGAGKDIFLYSKGDGKDVICSYTDAQAIKVLSKEDMSLTTWGQRTGHGGSNRRAFLTYLGRGYSVAIADVARTALDEEDFIVQCH